MVFNHCHGALGNIGVLFERRLNFTWLNPVAVDLDLAIDTAQKLDNAGLGRARAIAGTIKAGAGSSGKWIGQKTLGRLRGRIQIGAGHAGASQI